MLAFFLIQELAKLMPTQGLCTCYFLFLKYSSPGYLYGWPLWPPRHQKKCHLLREAFSDLLIQKKPFSVYSTISLDFIFCVELIHI